MTIAVISFTMRGGAKGREIAASLPEHEISFFEGTGKFGSLSELVASIFVGFDAVVFVCAIGIAVRGVAPCIVSKGSDPAVIVVGEDGAFVVPILSGHIGGANRLAAELATKIGATAVITTATDINGIVAFDAWAAQNGCVIADTGTIKHVAAAQLRGERFGLKSDFPVSGTLPEGAVIGGELYDSGVVISVKNLRSDYPHTLQLIPKKLHLGFGCRRGTSPAAALSFIQELLAEKALHIKSLRTVSSIDLKADEPALLNLGQELGLPVLTYTAEQLAETAGVFSASDFVLETTGVDNVCERAAARSSNGRLILEKTARDGMTAAIALEEWEAVF